MASTSASTPQLRPNIDRSLKQPVRKIARVRERSMELPERFKMDDEDEKNVNDGTGVNEEDENRTIFQQQSMYGMLAATRSKAEFPTTFQQDSESESESEDEESEDRGAAMLPKQRSKEAAQRQSLSPEPPSQDKQQDNSKKHRKRLSERKLVRSFLKSIRERADSQGQDPMTQSQFLPPKVEDIEEEDRQQSVRTDAPILDRKLQAMARAEREQSAVSSSGRKSREGRASEELGSDTKSKSLPHVIADIFQFDEPEEVVAEYPCWYLQNVLLQGYMYITSKHVCFYAYLQKKTAATVKVGHLGKLGKRSYRYRRYWFILKGDTFSYYNDSTDPYFPLGVVDLRYAISADLANDKGKDTAGDFTITTASRVYQYRADTPSSAKEWVKQLQKVIFRSHNDGDSVKISLPIDNIVDVEKANMIDFAETVKIRVIDNDETFAIDEYFFTFFSFGKDAVHLLTILTDGSNAKKAAPALDDSQTLPQKIKTPPEKSDFRSSMSMDAPAQLAEPVRATLSPLSAGDRSSPRLSGEQRRTSADVSRRVSGDFGRASFDRGRRSLSGQRSVQQRSTSKSPLSPSIQESSESFITTSEHQSLSTNDDEIDATMSASQMLTDDHVFRGPTLRMPQPRRTVSGSTVDRLRQESQQSSRSSSNERIPLRVQPPSRQQTEQSLGKTRPDLQRSESGGSARTVEVADAKLKPTGTGPKLIRGISAPFQHAMNVAGLVRSSSKRMGSYLSSSPKSYIDKWSDAIAGGKRNYCDADGLAPDDSVREPEQELDVAEHERRFHEHFGLPPSEKLVSTFYCWLHKTVPLYGKIYMGTRRFCFRSLWYGTKTKLVIPYKDILNVEKQRGFRWGYPGLCLIIRGYEELFFDFPSQDLRDDCVVTILRSLDAIADTAKSTLLTEEEEQIAEDAAAENELLRAARADGFADHDPVEPTDDVPPMLFDDPNASVLEFKPKKSMRITCLTIGSRGDVQPYIALCKGLIEDGHKPKIATHEEFKGWVEGHGIEFFPVGGNPAVLMKMCVDHGMFTPSFMYQAHFFFRDWLDKLFKSSWAACQGSDLLIESPSAMGGIHIAEALEIPYFRAFTMPWTRTRTYPHAFAVPTVRKGGAYNFMSYTFFDNFFWQAISGQVNKFRATELGLGPTTYDKLQQNKVPFLYNFSPHVVGPPMDFSDWIKVTGYWFLDEGVGFEPPADLAAFIQKARDDAQKLVYIGFGSVTVQDSRQLLQQVVDAVVKADVRCILSKGWSDRMDDKDKKAIEAPELELPACVHKINSAPHDWLFKHVDAAVIHGGAGTTGAELRAGVPTIIKPFFGDQFFFATRVEDLGVGIHLKKVTANQLGKALWIATHDTRMRNKASALGEQIRSEDGVKTAINAIYRQMDYAKSLIKRRTRPDEAKIAFDGVEAARIEEIEDDTEEDWTFVQKEGGPAASENTIMGQVAANLGVAELPTASEMRKASGQHKRNMSLGSLAMRSASGGRS